MKRNVRSCSEMLLVTMCNGEIVRFPIALSLRSPVAMSSAWRQIKAIIERWLAHTDARQGEALAYSVFSVGPLTVIAVGIAGLAKSAA